jgi:DNA-binding response OmpR family regulator
VERTSEKNDRRQTSGPDRRRFPRGGRRETDQPGRHPKIAVIDRYEGVRQPCVRYLEHFNFDVAEAADPQAGITLLESVRPALALMEEGETRDFERLHLQAGLLSIPCISMATALGDVQRPCDGLLVKPFALGAMLDELRRVLRLHLGTHAPDATDPAHAGDAGV